MKKALKMAATLESETFVHRRPITERDSSMVLKESGTTVVYRV
jgi:hypothetical protein